MAEKKKVGKRKFVLFFWLAFSGSIGGLFLLFLGISNFEILGKLPTFEELENPKSHLATEILSSDGHLLGTIFKENRSIVKYEELSEHLVTALVSTEDERYYEHFGIDGKSLARAIIKLGTAGGGSTITQQLAKMLFSKRPKNTLERIKQKLNEQVIAVRLERQYTKDEIITMYYNRLDFVNNGVGVKSASNVYFSCSPKDLRVEQAAMLTGMAKNPSMFNPLKSYRVDTVKHRRNVVLKQMFKNEVFSREAYDSLRVLPLGLKVSKASHKEGVATYFREEVRGQLRKIFRTLKKNDEENSSYNIYRDGLKIYTSINYDMQVAAEKAVKTHLGGELQDVFFKHWKKKGPSSKKFAPYYYENMSNAQKKQQVEQVILKGMRTSGRYKNAMYEKPVLRKRSIKYNRLYSKRRRLQNLKDNYEDVRFQKQQVVNLLSKDTTNTSEINRERGYAKRDVILYKDSVRWIKGLLEKGKEEYTDAKELYLELWEPFDDTMQTVFNKKIPMRVFSWKGSIDTTLSPRDSVIYHKWYLRTGLLSMDPKTGFIKAWVGGIDYKFFQYDQIRGTRQVGSTFKPFVYACAIENGISPCESVLNNDITFPAGKYGLEQSWTPKNASAKNLEGELVSLKMALANSINSISAKIMMDFGPMAVIDVARRCGITSNIDPVPSICLGTPDVSLFEMVSAYCVFANKGIWIEPSFILRIEDRNGSTIWSPTPDRREAMDEENAYKMIELMGGVASYGPRVNGRATYGTGVRLRSSARAYGGIPGSIKIAGKTGTTQNQSDGWFMGITPDVVTGVWVGCEDRAAHFTSQRLGMGTNMALPIWGYYMKSIWANKNLKISKGWFDLPPNRSKEDFDCGKRRTGSIDSGGGFDPYL